MSVQRIASRYAKSLIDLAIERNELEAVHKDVTTLNRDVKSNRDLYLLLKSPIVSVDKKRNVLNALYSQSFCPLMMSFFDIIVRKKREAYLPEIALDFVDQYRAHNNVTSAKLIAASAVSDELRQHVEKFVMEHTACKSVEFQIEIDPSLIGGFILEFEDKRYDASAAAKLAKMRTSFAGNN